MKYCPVCGSELKPLFSSFQCFNDNCGKQPGSEALEVWQRIFGSPYYLALPDDIEVVECAPEITADAWKITYKLKNNVWFGVQFVLASDMYVSGRFSLEAKDLWQRMRETRPVNFANLTKTGSWSVP